MNLSKYYAQLVGAKIIGFRFERDEHGDDQGWPIFTVEMQDGEKVDLVLSQDPEGNGGGFAFIEEAA